MAVVVSDAGPLIALAKTESLFVLRCLFSEVVVPDAVWRECAGKDGADSRRIEEAAADGWLSFAAVQVTERFPRSLGRGEVEAIQLALDASVSAFDCGRPSRPAGGDAPRTVLHGHGSRPPFGGGAVMH